MDYAPTLSWQQLWLSSDPDDWVWARWYWARPTARPLDIISAYGHMMWETDVEHPMPQPGLPLEGGYYARSRVSPYPGLHRIGPEEYWLDGVPRSARVPADAGTHCGVETFWSDLPCRMAMGIAVPPDGLVWMAEGGDADAGAAAVGAGYSWSATGGDVDLGEATYSSGYGWTATGGDVDAGVADQSGESAGWAGGGDLDGGESVMGTSPQWEAYTLSPWATTDGVTVTVPATTAGELSVVTIHAEDAATLTWGTPAGWALLTSGTNGGDSRYAVWTRTYVGGDPATVAFTWSGGAKLNRALGISFRDAGTPTLYAGDSGSSVTACGGPVTLASTSYSTLLLVVVAPGVPTGLTAPAGYEPVE